MFGELEALLVAGFVGGGDGEADDEVLGAERDAAVAGGGAGPSVLGSTSLKRMARPSWVARKMTCWPSVILAAMSSSSLSMLMEMMPRAMTFEKSRRGVFLTVPFLVAKRTKWVGSLRSRTGRMVTTFSPGWRATSEGHGLAFAGGADVGDLVDLEPVDAAGVGEAEEVGGGWS